LEALQVATGAVPHCVHIFFKPPSEKEILKMNWRFYHPALGHSRFHFFFFRKVARAFAVFLLDG
jgi:hypothetical protein